MGTRPSWTEEEDEALRREVARRLRDIESIYGEQRHPFPETDFVLAIAKITGTPLDSTLKDLAFRLADLIEPPNDEPAFSLEVLRGVATMQLYMCGRCNAMIAGYSDATTFYAPRFCPNCGARVTGGVER